MMVPQPTAQYGQVDRVSLARAIFSVRSCAYAGFRSKPKTAAAAPPMVVSFRKSRREGFMLGPPSARDKVGRVSRNLLNRNCPLARKALVFPQGGTSWRSRARFHLRQDSCNPLAPRNL